MNRIMKNQRAARIGHRNYSANITPRCGLLFFGLTAGSPALRYMERRNTQRDALRAGGAQ